jgi:hypothetical protein
VELDKELVHLVVDERDLVVGHEAGCQYDKRVAGGNCISRLPSWTPTWCARARVLTASSRPCRPGAWGNCAWGSVCAASTSLLRNTYHGGREIGVSRGVARCCCDDNGSDKVCGEGSAVRRRRQRAVRISV